MDIDPNKCVAYIMENAPKFAQAKAERVFIENFLRTVKSRLMQKRRVRWATKRLMPMLIQSTRHN
jgi:hypothetical protein